MNVLVFLQSVCNEREREIDWFPQSNVIRYLKIKFTTTCTMTYGVPGRIFWHTQIFSLGATLEQWHLPHIRSYKTLYSTILLPSIHLGGSLK